MRWWLETMLAFFLAMGVAAHALDELHGRPLGTRHPRPRAEGPRVVGLAGAAALGVHGALEVTPWIWVLIPVGGFLVVAYNLELFGGAFHSDLWFALAWGAFPVVTAYFAQTGSLECGRRARRRRVHGALGGAARALDAGARLRRHATMRVGNDRRRRRHDATPLDASALRAAPEGALRLLSRRDAAARGRVDRARSC